MSRHRQALGCPTLTEAQRKERLSFQNKKDYHRSKILEFVNVDLEQAPHLQQLYWNMTDSTHTQAQSRQLEQEFVDALSDKQREKWRSIKKRGENIRAMEQAIAEENKRDAATEKARLAAINPFSTQQQQQQQQQGQGFGLGVGAPVPSNCYTQQQQQQQQQQQDVTARSPNGMNFAAVQPGVLGSNGVQAPSPVELSPAGVPMPQQQHSAGHGIGAPMANDVHGAPVQEQQQQQQQQPPTGMGVSAPSQYQGMSFGGAAAHSGVHQYMYGTANRFAYNGMGGTPVGGTPGGVMNAGGAAAHNGVVQPDVASSGPLLGTPGQYGTPQRPHSMVPMAPHSMAPNGMVNASPAPSPLEFMNTLSQSTANLANMFMHQDHTMRLEFQEQREAHSAQRAAMEESHRQQRACIEPLTNMMVQFAHPFLSAAQPPPRVNRQLDFGVEQVPTVYPTESICRVPQEPPSPAPSNPQQPTGAPVGQPTPKAARSSPAPNGLGGPFTSGTPTASGAPPVAAQFSFGGATSSQTGSAQPAWSFNAQSIGANSATPAAPPNGFGQGAPAADSGRVNAGSDSKTSSGNPFAGFTFEQGNSFGGAPTFPTQTEAVPAPGATTTATPAATSASDGPTSLSPITEGQEEEEDEVSDPSNPPLKFDFTTGPSSVGGSTDTKNEPKKPFKVHLRKQKAAAPQGGHNGAAVPAAAAKPAPPSKKLPLFGGGEHVPACAAASQGAAQFNYGFPPVTNNQQTATATFTFGTDVGSAATKENVAPRSEQTMSLRKKQGKRKTTTYGGKRKGGALEEGPSTVNNSPDDKEPQPSAKRRCFRGYSTKM